MTDTTREALSPSADHLLRLAEDFADACVSAGYVTTKRDAHKTLVAALATTEQAPAPSIALPIDQSIAIRAEMGDRAEKAPAALTDEQVGQLEYRGNSVAYIHQKLTAYRGAIDKAWGAMRAAGFPPDGKTALAEAITAAIAAAHSVPEQAEQPNLACPSVQHRLATQWGYVKAEQAPAALTDEWALNEMVNRFLSWRLPDSVCADGCAVAINYPHPRYGTNLLTADEARQMLQHVLGGAK